MRRIIVFFALALAALPAFAQPATAASTIPFVGCPSRSDGGPITPSGEPIKANIPENIANKLALYVNVFNLAVLAPRGWKCSGWQSVGGNSISIYPSSSSLHETSVVSIASTAYTNGIPNKYVLYFPTIMTMKAALNEAAAWGETPDQYIIKRYFSDHITYIDKTTIEFVTPANHVGLGDTLLSNPDVKPVPVPLRIYGLIGYNMTRDSYEETLAVELPENLSYLHTYITSFAEDCYFNKQDCAITTDSE